MSEAKNDESELSQLLCAGWHIKYVPKPIPDRRFDWDYWHDDYDYCGETGSNSLSGTAASKAEAIEACWELDEHRTSALNEEGYKRFSA